MKIGCVVLGEVCAFKGGTMTVDLGQRKNRSSFLNSKNQKSCIPNYPKNYYFSNISFGGVKSNYLVTDSSKGGLVPVVISPGVDLRHYADGNNAYPGFKINGADFSKGCLDHCYMKNSEITNSNLTNVSAHRVHLHNSKITNSNLTQFCAIESVFKYSDFSDSILRDANVKKSNFENCIFKNTDFTRGKFSECNFMGADLSEAKNLETANLFEALYDDDTKFPKGFNPQNSNMVKFEKGADLRDIYFAPETVKTANQITDGIEKADYSDIDFSHLYIAPDNTKTKFNRCNFSGLIFDRCKFENIDAMGTSFSGCSLYGTIFRNANLAYTDFHNALPDETMKFEGDINLQGANLIGFDLRHSGIEKLKSTAKWGNPFKSAMYDVSTQFPKDFNPEEHGMIYIGYEQDLSNMKFSYMSFRNGSIGIEDVISLENSIFIRTDFTQTDLSNMNMKNSNFREAYLRDTCMHSANCENSSFCNAKLFCTDLSGANMKNTDLTNAKMQGVKVDKNTDFTGAKYNDDTIFPDDFPIEKKKTMIYIPKVMAKEI